MPSVEVHTAQATRNLAFCDALIGDANAPHDWAMTALFYSAVHFGRAAAGAFGLGPLTSHFSFETHLQREMKAPSHIYSAYRTLKDEAERARYDCCPIVAAEVTKLRGTRFSVFRTWCEGQIDRMTTPSK